MFRRKVRAKRPAKVVLLPQKEPGVNVVLLLSRSLDRSIAREVSRMLRENSKAGRRMLVDLGSVENLNSFAVGSILRWLRVTHLAGAGFALCNLTPNTRAVAEAVGLHHFVRIYNSQADGIEAAMMGAEMRMGPLNDKRSTGFGPLSQEPAR